MKYQTKELIAEFGNKSIIVVELILRERPTRYYWDTYDDEQDSAQTYWEEILNELKEHFYN